ncbi:TPA: 1-deoxy-D-xylulose-5-phosphate reductoisomerase, partial [Neisseria meningitidis]
MPSENASDGIRYKVIPIMTPQVLTILGSTGSIGESTLDVVSLHPEKFRVFALAGHKQVEKLAVQCRTFRPEYAV